MFYKHILVTTDFSPAAQRAFDVAAYQAKMEGSKVTLVHVVEELMAPLLFHEFDLGGVDVEAIQKRYAKESEAKLAKIASASFHGQKVEYRSITKTHSVANALCEFAKAQGCDLIVMASQGRSGTLQLLGSVTESVVREAPCPVLVIPPKV